MKNQTNEIEQTVKPTIKERLLARFVVATTQLGDNWREQLVVHNPYFNTKRGVYDYQAVSLAAHNPRRADADRIERVTEALEAIVNSKQA